MEIIKAVSDSSPLISFSAIGKLSLLKELFPKGIIISQAVFDEITFGEQGKEAIINAIEEKWISVIQISKKDIYKSLIHKGLDKGESEAITLAYEKKMLVLLDETEARREAKNLGLSFTGAIGCLLKAKQKSLVLKIKPLLDSMIETTSFRVSPALYFRILKEAGE